VFEESALAALVEPRLAVVAARVGRTPLDLALHGGEDYALVAASTEAIPGFTRVGHFDRGRPNEGGPAVLLERSGVTRPIEPGGWDHFPDD
jgi:thiamine-monophosphate kinase